MRGVLVPLRTVVREWGRIGCIGFGGPPAHIALLRELCVERRGWISTDEFEQRVNDGEFVEHATYSGRRYGTLRSELEGRLRRGEPVVLEIEVQGARQVREAMPEALQVFIAPPSREALRARLVGRGTDTAEQVDARLQTAEGELEAQSEFSHVVVNDRLEDALEELVDIVRGEVGAPASSPSPE